MIVYLYYSYFTYQSLCPPVAILSGRQDLNPTGYMAGSQAPFMGWDDPHYPLGQSMLRCYSNSPAAWDHEAFMFSALDAACGRQWSRDL